MRDQDTIVAIATPPGRGGIGVVRLSGPHAVAIATPLLRLRRPLAPGRVRRAQVLDPASGAVLDEAVVTWFAAPHSYTTEDVMEISCHGSPMLLAAMLAACVAAGARLAEAGEFTQRAFLAGRLDLTAAEAVHDLVGASTLAQARTAAAQLGGSVARAVRPAREQLLALIVELEAGIDFAEDDLELIAGETLRDRLAETRDALRALVESYRFGRVLHQGLTLAVAGRPNAGKSSLFNRLLGRPRAIVTAMPGTTRDTITETLELDGVPVRLIDTAGVRDVPAGEEGEAERQGIARSQEAVAEADAVLLVQEASEALSGDRNDDLMFKHLSPEMPFEDGRTVLRVLTKADLLSHGQRSAAGQIPGALLTSSMNGEGIDELRAEILRRVTGQDGPAGEGAVVTSLRQHTALAAALGHVESALHGAEAAVPHEMLLVDLYSALESLDLLTGATERDEVLNRIFSGFCIGK